MAEDAANSTILSFDEVLKLLSFWAGDVVTKENIDKLIAFANNADNGKYDNYIPINALFNVLRIGEFSDENAAKLFSIILAKANKGIYNNSDNDVFVQQALHQAIIGNRRQIFDILLAKGLDINGQDDFKMTPLHWAIKLNRVNHVKKLLNNKNKLDLIIKDYKGRTALDMIDDKTDPEIIAAIRQYLKDTKQSAIFKHVNTLFINNNLQQQLPEPENKTPLLMPAGNIGTNPSIHQRKGYHRLATREDTASSKDSKQAGEGSSSIASYIKGWLGFGNK